jgi:hypothetical protein
MTILRRDLPSYSGTETDSQEVGTVCIKTDITTCQRKVSPNITLDMQTWQSPAMSDQDLLNAMITHYEPRIQNYLLSANLKSTQLALAFYTKLQSPENFDGTIQVSEARFRSPRSKSPNTARPA